MDHQPIQVTRPSLPPLAEYVAEIQSIWETSCLTNMGALHQKFENDVADYLKVRHLSLFANGHLALEIALQAMKLTGEVITTPFTFVSTTHAIVRNGLTPVFCDIKADDYTLDPEKIEPLINEKTRAILPVHVYGSVCDVNAISRVAQKYGLKVIYDAAHAFGVRVNDEGIGSFGDISMFSFHATKVFNTIEGGALAYSDESLAERLNQLKNFGIASPENVVDVGLNAKMNEFQAAMGICNLRHIDTEIARRKEVVERYRHHLSGRKGLQLVPPRPDVNTNYAYFPVVFEESKFGKTRDAVFSDLMDEGIYARKYFYPLTSHLECFRDRFIPHRTPVAADISDRVLTLPLYADLTIDDVDRICKIILRR